ncbi:MAG: sugar phosphorylase [Pseudomonadota bacterium]
MNILEQKLTALVEQLYPQASSHSLVNTLLDAIGCDDSSTLPPRHRNLWNENDAWLITYGNSIVKNDEAPLQTLKQFLDSELQGIVTGVHVLPFFPFSSDDGFAVIDYLKVNDALGDWKHIESLSRDYDVMGDLVINHISSRSRWFENFKKQVDPGKDYFHAVDPAVDLTQVVRPRPTPLLREVETRAGKKYVWCTFGPDQVDVNFANTDVLIEYVRILGAYLDAGIRMFRMDAIAFLWKELGTPCIHHSNTHAIIRLLRLLIEARRNDAIIVTETNVPNRENLTYFGNNNQAHIIYNFSLPPLVLFTLFSGDCKHLKTWLMSMPPAQDGTCYLNFLASHDGIGLRPTEGLLSDRELQSMLDGMRSSGGVVSMRKMPDGNEKPYELNIALFDAFKTTKTNEIDGLQIERFICAHAIMLALEGIPAIYIHSFFGTENDYARKEHTGRARSINRHVWQLTELADKLKNKDCHERQVFDELKRLVCIRRSQSAFHPNATQFTLHLGLQLFGFWRQSADRKQSIFCVSNITNQQQTLPLGNLNLIVTDEWCDLISGVRLKDLDDNVALAPYQTMWISNLAPTE